MTRNTDAGRRLQAGLTLATATVASTVTAAALLAAPAAAAAPAGPAAALTAQLPKDWTVTGPFPAPEPSFTEPAGEVCTFALRIHTDVNRTQVLHYADPADPAGTTRADVYYGELVSTATNLATGAHERLDLSASGLFRYHRNGSTDIDAIGPYGLGLHAGDTALGRPGPFFAVPNGLSTTHVTAAGHVHIETATSVRDVCAELS